jgi:Fe2+ or Zn2+ uptake regulation protein
LMRMRINHIQPPKERVSTPQRRLLFDVLRQAKGCLDARELYRRAVEKDPHISLATVYRNLRLFKELGLVEEAKPVIGRVPSEVFIKAFAGTRRAVERHL